MNISKKVIGAVVALILLFGNAGVFASESGSVVFSDAQIIKGKQETVRVSLKNLENVSSFYLYNLDFNRDNLELADVKLLVEGASVSHADKETGEIVFAFSENTDCRGDIAEFTFVGKGEKSASQIKADVKIKYWNNESEIFCEDINVVSGQIEVVSGFPSNMRLEDAETEYNGKAQGIKVKNLLSGANVRYLVDGEEKEAVKAGEYKVTAIVTKDGYADWERTATLRITPAPLEIKGLKAKDKVYDGTKDAVIDKTEALLDGVFPGDEVYVEFPWTGTFEDENAKSTKTNVYVEKPELSGKDNANYTLGDIAPLKAKITKARQEIAVSEIPEKIYGDIDFYVVSEASSGLPLTYKSENELVAKISENGLVEIIGAGKTKIKITQTGNSNYESSSAETEFVVLPKTITFTDIDFENQILAPTISESGILSEDMDDVAFDFSRVKAFVSEDKVIYNNFFLKGEKGGNYKIYVPGGLIEKELVKEEAVFNSQDDVTATVKKAAGTNTLIFEEVTLSELSHEPEFVTLDLSGEENGTVDSVILPGEFLEDTGSKASLEIKLTESSVVLDKAALTHLSENLNNANISLSIREADDGELEEEQVNAKEKLDNARVFRLTIDGVSVEDGRVDFGQGKVKVSLNYEASSTARVKVKYIKEDGTTQSISATYDKKTKKVSFGLSHFSEYVVYTEGKASSGGGGGGGGSMDATLTFITDGGKEISSIKAPLNATINLDKYIGEKEGFVFEGWFLEPELKTIVTEIKLKDNMTLYAKWKEKYETNIVLTIGKKEAAINGKVVTNDTAPEIVNGRTMLPVRFVAETLSSIVTWNPENREVTIIKDEKIIKLIIDNDIALVDGTEVKIDSSPYIKNDRTYLPVRFIAESLDCEVEWNEKTGEVTIKK